MNEELVVGINGGKKTDKDKIRFELIPFESLKKIAEIMTFGATKYDDDNWKSLEIERIVGAMMRHLVAWLLGERIDEESGLLHTSHMACNAMFINYFDIKKE